MSCDIDPINMCCWTHGVDLSPEETMEECCYLGESEDEYSEEEVDDFDDFNDDTP